MGENMLSVLPPPVTTYLLLGHLGTEVIPKLRAKIKVTLTIRKALPSSLTLLRKDLLKHPIMKRPAMTTLLRQ